MKNHESIKSLMDLLDERFPGATLKHSWLNGTASPSRQYQIKDYDSGELFFGLSHFIIERDGEVLATAQVFINFKD